MKRLSDDEWLAAARSRLASGSDWSTPREELLAPGSSLPVAPAEAPLLMCPFCDAHPPLLLAARPGRGEEWLYCPACCGFWGKKAGLAAGMNSDDVVSPAFQTIRALPRCRSCGARLRADGACTACKNKPPRPRCPACRVEMQQAPLGGVIVDVCAGCGGTWFDAGEVATVYRLEWPRELAESAALASGTGMLGDPDAPPGWLYAVFSLVRLLLQFA